VLFEVHGAHHSLALVAAALRNSMRSMIADVDDQVDAQQALVVERSLRQEAKDLGGDAVLSGRRCDDVAELGLAGGAIDLRR